VPEQRTTQKCNRNAQRGHLANVGVFLFQQGKQGCLPDLVEEQNEI
jgi:hypothetical protein